MKDRAIRLRLIFIKTESMRISKTTFVWSGNIMPARLELVLLRFNTNMGPFSFRFSGARNWVYLDLHINTTTFFKKESQIMVYWENKM